MVDLGSGRKMLSGKDNPVVWFVISCIITGILIGILFLAKWSDDINCIKTEYKNVEAEIIDTHYTPESHTYMMIGGMLYRTGHDAEYSVDLKYDKCIFNLTDKKSYNKCKTKIGKNTKAKLKVEYYKDGTIKRSIVEVIDDE